MVIWPFKIVEEYINQSNSNKIAVFTFNVAAIKLIVQIVGLISPRSILPIWDKLRFEA